MNKQIILQSMEEHQGVIDDLKRLEYEIAVFSEKIIDVIRWGRKVLLMGNGGSAADSQHIAAEIVGRYKTERKGLPAIALTTDTSILTSVGNDFSFEHVFARQVEALAAKDDMVIAISTSGNSKNIITALKKAAEAGCYTVGLLGRGGGKIKELVDLPIIVPSDNTPRIQECHILIGHIACELLDEAFK